MLRSTLSWGFQDEYSDYAQAVLESLEYASAITPALWIAEVSNTLTMGLKRNRMTEKEVAHFITGLKPLHIMIDNANHQMDELISFCRAYNLKTYDAMYLKLAIAAALPIATLYHLSKININSYKI